MVRVGRDMTQLQVANECEVTKSFISALELGKRDLTWSMIEKMCATLQVSPGLVVLVTQEDDSDCRPFTHAAYAMLWNQIKRPY